MLIKHLDAGKPFQKYIKINNDMPIFLNNCFLGLSSTKLPKICQFQEKSFSWIFCAS